MGREEEFFDPAQSKDLQGDWTQLKHGLAALVSRVRQKDGNESTSCLFCVTLTVHCKTLPQKGKSPMSALNQPPLMSRPGTGQKEDRMKLNNLAKAVVLGLAVFVATGAFASNKGSLHVTEAVEVNGQQIPAGDYTIRWEGTGSNVELSVMQGKKELARTSAREVELDQASSYDAAVVNHSNGRASVAEIRFAGKKTALDIGGSDRASMSDSSK